MTVKLEQPFTLRAALRLRQRLGHRQTVRMRSAPGKRAANPRSSPPSGMARARTRRAWPYWSSESSASRRSWALPTGPLAPPTRICFSGGHLQVFRILGPWIDVFLQDRVDHAAVFIG